MAYYAWQPPREEVCPLKTLLLKVITPLLLGIVLELFANWLDRR
ncbi:type I toxin-antitoxin system Fst family toxin [Lacticaseibacillus suibinensis]|nr:type I toxin-antitoxin system Fst family toxin [Lacticaseibacillus suibinensis]